MLVTRPQKMPKRQLNTSTDHSYGSRRLEWRLLDLYMARESISCSANINQISDATLPISRKAKREQERETTKIRRMEQEEAANAPFLNAGTKRKRSDVDESDPKLKEFLEVMQPASKPKVLAKQLEADSMIEPPTKMQAMEIPEGGSDGEYETVLKKSRKKSPSRVTAPPMPAPIISTAEQSIIPGKAVVDPVPPNATDDDWLRSRTNRLLDLMDPEDMVGGGVGTLTNENIELVAEISADVDKPVNVDDVPAEDAFEEEEDKLDPTIEAIKTNGRLFARNLPYSASEDDLRQHFEPFGSLEEVRMLCFFSMSFIPLPLHDEYPDRDSLCFKHVM